MPGAHNFEYLPLLRSYVGPARLRGHGNPSPQTLANRNARQAHSGALRTAAHALSANWHERNAQRQRDGLPVMPTGVPILLQVDPGLDLDALREKYSFEIVAEQDEGFVIVASQDIELGPFLAMLDGFSVAVHGSATIAQVHRLFDEPNQLDRLARILSERLFAEWPMIGDHSEYIVDIGIACTGTREIANRPKRGKRDTDATWAAKEQAWTHDRAQAYVDWDDIKAKREQDVLDFAESYGGGVLSILDGADFEAGVLPDSFTVRLKIVGRGLKDFVLNYAYVFEVVEPEDIALPQDADNANAEEYHALEAVAPGPDAPTVCVIDSGIQEGHALIQQAMHGAGSRCLLPGKAATEVADEVAPSGHGTRVAGAVLYGEVIPNHGQYQLPFWIQNIRVLDENNRMPMALFPPQATRAAVEHSHNGPMHTRIFNQSINARGHCRIRYMSSWAAEIDSLCAEYDIVFIQSAGNIPISGVPPYIGVKDHLSAGRSYPDYFVEASSRIANPGQSLQAITVGSISYGEVISGSWRTFAAQTCDPSAFSRSGPGLWSVIKPEVVEFGGDSIHTTNQPVDVQGGGGIPTSCPELVRSTLHAGPATGRDQAGTSYAAPKVARIAAQLQALLPTESALLYRALVIQSAQWPVWAEDILNQLRNANAQLSYAQRQNQMVRATNVMRSIGYGVPDMGRATTNDDYRTTLITSAEVAIRAGNCHIYQVPIPAQLRQQADEFDIRIDVTLSYVALPRRTRRNRRRYLSTWVDWITSNLGEGLNDFRVRAMKDTENNGVQLPGTALPWTLHEMPHFGLVRDYKRSSGTAQKDWAVVKSNMLPDHFCIAVRGHQGWSRDPDNAARYAMAVTFEIVGQEINIYDPLRNAVIELQAEVEVEIEIEVDAGVEEDA